MKANNISGTIKLFPALPKIGKNYTNFDKASIALQEQEGFYDVVIPAYNSELQHLDNLHGEEIDRVFTYDIIDKVFDLETLREQKLKEFSTVLDEFAVLITRCQLINGYDNSELNAAIEQTRQMRTNTITAINGIDNVQDMLAFKIRQEDISMMKSLFKPFK